MKAILLASALCPLFLLATTLVLRTARVERAGRLPAESLGRLRAHAA